MPFSKDILMGSSGAGGAAADPEAISQDNFEAWFVNGTQSTFTYEDSTYGNYLVLGSPLNTFYEHNSIKPSGFSGHSYIQWQINGYAWAFFGIFQSTTTSESFLAVSSSTLRRISLGKVNSPSFRATILVEPTINSCKSDINYSH